MIGFRLFVEQMRVYLDFIVSQLEVYDWFQTIEVAYRRAGAWVVSEEVLRILFLMDFATG